MSLYAVIMAGGVGSRFWPRSRQAQPKQFLDVFGASSMIQNTFARLQPMIPAEHVFVVTNTKYVEQTREHLPAVPPENILAEPIARNTAPCIAFAAATIRALDPDATMVVLPADHLIDKPARFHAVLDAAVAKAQTPGALVTIGIEPTHPETGYGYIQYDTTQAAGGDGAAGPQAFPVKTFAEKPDLPTAERFLDSGDFLWNSGMFIWRADSILASMAQHLPEVHACFAGIGTPADTTEDQVRDAYERSPKISIDYGIMERADDVHVVPGSFGWSDVGDWRAVYERSAKDDAGNATDGDVIAHNSSRCYARSADRLVVLVGVRDLAVVDTDDAILVCNLDATQQVKHIVDYLGAHRMDEFV
ncbi:MAG: mannose-1-phosphate guanylyltransferase [Bacteroidota bacterium]